MFSQFEPGTFTFDGKKYELHIVKQCVRYSSITKVALTDVAWVLPYTFVDTDSIEKANLKIPILVTMNSKNKVTVIDGAHRVTKAIDEGVISLPAKWVTKSMLKKALIKK